jgi:c-di-GMP-binding flagellar brake protein YcgR
VQHESKTAPLDLDDKTKRRWDRYKVEIRVKVSLTREGQPLNFAGTAHDISEGGMGLFLPAELHPGETILIDFAMPYSQRLVIQGVVRNRHRFQYGVQYLNPSAEDRESIVRNCRALALLG